MRFIPAILFGLLLMLGGCPSVTVGDGPVPAQSEVAMAPGTVVTAVTPSGTMKIAAGKGLGRSYTWAGGTRAVEMWPRAKRWNGSLGLYYPGVGDHWRNHDGITRGVVQEGQQHFDSVEQASAWIAEQKRGIPLVYRDDGLVVGWSTVPERRQLNVDVWQILIGGKKPTELPGSENGSIVVTADVPTPG